MPNQSIVFSILATPELIPDGDLVPLLDLLSDLSPVLDLIGIDMAQWQKENFESQGSVFERPWPANKAATDQEKRRLGYSGRTLVRTGDLETEVGGTMLMTSDGVTTGIGLDLAHYAAYHDDPGPSSPLPQRILVALVPAEVEGIQHRLVEFIASKTGIVPTGISIIAGSITGG